MASDDNVPSYSPNKASGKSGPYVSGRAAPGDPTNEPGQYPPGDWGTALFGGTLPTGTGAPGTRGISNTDAADVTNQPGQVDDGLTGISEHDITSTGAPGTQGATYVGNDGSDSITYTEVGSFLDGTWESNTVRDDVSGGGDWTQANDSGYNTGGPQLPGIAGNEPGAGEGRYQPGAGRVMRGGRMVNG